MITIHSPMHDLIVFGSQAVRPFAGLLSGRNYKEEFGDEDHLQFFAFTIDGMKAGVIGDPDYPYLYRLPSDIYRAIKVIRYSYRLDFTKFPATKLPEECYQSVGKNTLPCFEFQFSPNGEYLGYRYGGYLHGPANVRIIEIQSGAVVYASSYDRNHFFLFTPDNRILMAFGHLEGGSISIFDPKTQKVIFLGPEKVKETVSWNNQYTAFVVDSHDYHGVNSHIWGFNLQTNQIFLQDYGSINAYIWTPDGSSVLYEKSDILKVNNYGIVTYNVVRLMLAPINGTPRQLLGHYNYDFHLCIGNAYGYAGGCTWIGDWFPILRIPAGEREIGYDDRDDCMSYAIDCPNPSEHFLLNWRTGQLISPDAVIQVSQNPTFDPTPSPTPIPGPNLARQPVYTHPSGAYAFYVGLDGNSLWLVPKVGDPVLWVADGQNFIYIP